MKIGIHSWVLETGYPLAKAIGQAAIIGYDGYEIDIGNFGGTGLGFQILPDRMTPASKREIKTAQQEAGIEICSLSLGALWHYPLAGNAEVHRVRGIEITKAAVDLAKFLGADCILLPLAQPEGVTNKEAWTNAKKSIQSCLDIAEKLEVILAIENVCSGFLLKAPEIAQMVDEIDSPYCQVYYDVANNAWLDIDPAVEIKILDKRICRFHFKNRSSLRGNPDSTTNSVGDPGIVNFESVWQAINDINFDGYVVVEVPTFGQDAEQIALNNLSAIRELSMTMT